MIENNPMTVGALREMLPEPGSPEYNLPIKVYTVRCLGVGTHDDDYEISDCDIDCVVKISELGKPTSDFFRIEIA